MKQPIPISKWIKKQALLLLPKVLTAQSASLDQKEALLPTIRQRAKILERLLFHKKSYVHNSIEDLSEHFNLLPLTPIIASMLQDIHGCLDQH